MGFPENLLILTKLVGEEESRGQRCLSVSLAEASEAAILEGISVSAKLNAH